ncbi:hypothetical protein PC129_g14381 [Phytophthora cactorum]|uniref:FYVE-type domain-containing protein n=2 Tax=Phytophthora cactorum TaxID=29920 RepID=A0A329RT27_9STRA|nr:hypothetical protein Pcac1_g25713 [Phytophthora cactorum]KAG2808422.1 hypothetical protein PC111_g16497 [Phytophthora cactorum]KAG2821688.1 hypothetical protein PC112_g11254 [Phytophthora cactorum]KAG2850701.1 hypothetical protein PC113_g16550 [Phytophthora cactorum]KAG2885387.1 hypothetical protein PC114_g19694 [Phytophthora cactorum]
MAPSFPLSRLLLPKVKVAPEEHRQAKQMMTRLLQHTVQAFENFAYDAQGVTDTARWKHIGSQDDLKIYKERVAGATSSGLAAELGPDTMLANSDAVAALASPTMMMTGSCPGSVANTMSAAISQNQDELSLLVNFMHEDVADCAVLHTVDSPTAENPYHYFGYKYFVRKSPGAPGLVKHRDSLYLEYSGTCTTRQGEALGFVLLHSVNLPHFPDLASYNSIRALQSVRFLYRQRSHEVVEVFMLGNMDVSGMVIKPIADKLAQVTLFALVQLTDCAEAKKLTHMVQERRPSVLVRSRHPQADECQLCGKTPKKNSLLSSTSKLLVKCECCGLFACSTCRDIKRIYVPNSDHILGKFQKVPICMACIVEANETPVASPQAPVSNSLSSGSSGQRRGRSPGQHSADPLSARSDKSVSAAVAAVSAAVANMATRPKPSSYPSSYSAGSYSSAIASTPVGRASPTSNSPTQPVRAYRGNCRSGDWNRSPRPCRSLSADAVSPMQPRDVPSNARVCLSGSLKQMVVRSDSAGKPPMPTSNLSPLGSHRTSGGTSGSSNRSSRSVSTGNSMGPQDAMYARLMELNDVAEQTSAYVSSRGRRM